MQASTDRNNTYLLETVVRSSIILPPVMAIWRRHYDIHTEGTCIAALLFTQRVPEYEGVWKFHLLHDPLDYIHRGRLVQSDRDTWFQNRTHRILVQRSSSRPEANQKLFDTVIQYSNYQIVCDHTTIPVIRLHNDSLILPSNFALLENTQNQRFRFTLKLGDIYSDPVLEAAAAYIHEEVVLEREAEQELDRLIRSISVVHAPHTTVPNAPLPQRIVNGFIEGIVARGETCPIEMTELTKETACVTPCGHTMTFDAAECWIRGAHSCPVCRAPLELRHLQRWSS
jgi:hypothetical protein